MEKYEQPRILIEIFTKENVVFTSINWGGGNNVEEDFKSHIGGVGR